MTTYDGRASLTDLTATVERVRRSVEGVIEGKPEVVRLSLTVLLAEGHLLIEDVPGVGKTMLAKALARSVDCSVRRIQFTPDLLPSDITGVSVYDQQQAEFEFKPGAIFAQIVIGDEINRASPKTQSALLESMEERQVTVDGHSYALPSPFMVVATQNPVEMEGTYPSRRRSGTASWPGSPSATPPPTPSCACSTCTAPPHRWTTSSRWPTPTTSSSWWRRSARSTSRTRYAATPSPWWDPPAATPSCGSGPRRVPPCTWCGPPRPPPRWRAGSSRSPTTCRRWRCRSSRTGCCRPPRPSWPAAPRSSWSARSSRARPSPARPTARCRTSGARTPPPGRVMPGPGADGARERGGVRGALGGLTTRGRSFLAAGLAAAFCAYLLGQGDLLRVGLLLAVLPLLCVLFLHRTRHRVEGSRRLTPAQVPAGSEARVTLRVDSVSRLPTGVLMLQDKVPYVLGPRPRFLLDRVEPGGRREVSYRVRSDLRGRYPLGPLQLRLTDPFGMCELDRAFSGQSTLTVVPRVEKLPPLRPGGEARGFGEGRQHTLALAGEDDLIPRGYRHGDDLRRVHWRSTARLGELMVRREEQPQRTGCTVLLDTRAAGYAGSGPGSAFEWAVAGAASALLHLLEKDIPARLVTDTGDGVPAEVPPRRTAAGRDRRRR